MEMTGKWQQDFGIGTGMRVIPWEREGMEINESFPCTSVVE